MRRRNRDLRITRNHWREHLKVVHDYPRKPIDCACELQVGRFRKTGGHGCGKARCLLCHHDKIFQVPTRKEREARFDFREQLRDLGR